MDTPAPASAGEQATLTNQAEAILAPRQVHVLADTEVPSAAPLAALVVETPEQVGLPAIGIAAAVLPPVQDEEPEARGFESGRQYRALAPACLVAQRQLEFQLVRVKPPASYVGKASEQWLCTLPTVGILSTAELRARHDKCRDVVDLRNIVFGVTKGVIRTSRIVGIEIERSRTQLRVLRGLELERPIALTVEPGWAAAFIGTVDESVIRARRAMSAAFPDATYSQTDLTEVCRHGREMLDAQVEPTRYLARLAAMLAETALADMCAGTRTRWDIERPARAVDCADWDQYRKRIRDDAVSESESNYVPWCKLASYTLPHEPTYARVMRFAAGKGPSFVLRNGERLKPMWWPAIPHCRFITSMKLSAEDDTISEWDFSMNDVWCAARLWAYRYADQKVLDALLQTYLILAWARRGHPETHLVFPYARTSIRMPEARMRGYLMCPYLISRDEIVSAASNVGSTDMLPRIAETLMQSVLIGYAVDWCKWLLLDYTLLNANARHEDRATFAQLVRGTESTGNLWCIVQSWVSDLGYSGDIGRYLSTVATSQRTHLVSRAAEHALLHRINSADMLGWFKNVPVGSAAQGYLRPEPLHESLRGAGNAVMISDIAADKRSATLAGIWELEQVETISVLQARELPAITAKTLGGVDYCVRSGTQDNPVLALTLEDGSRVRWGFRLSFGASFAATDAAHDRFSLNWYVARRSMGRVSIKALPGCRVERAPASIPPQPGLKLPNDDYNTDVEQQSESDSSVSSTRRRSRSRRHRRRSSDSDSSKSSDVSDDDSRHSTRTARAPAEQPPPVPQPAPPQSSAPAPPAWEQPAAAPRRARPAEGCRPEPPAAQRRPDPDGDEDGAAAQEPVLVRTPPSQARNRTTSAAGAGSGSTGAAGGRRPGPGGGGGANRASGTAPLKTAAPPSGARIQPLGLSARPHEPAPEPHSPGPGSFLYDPETDIPSRQPLLAASYALGTAALTPEQREYMTKAVLDATGADAGSHIFILLHEQEERLTIAAEREVLQWLDALTTHLDTTCPSPRSVMVDAELSLLPVAENLERLRTAGRAAMAKLSWRHSPYTREECEILRGARVALELEPRLYAWEAVHCAIATLHASVEFERVIVMTCEVGALAAEWKEVFAAQREAATLCQQLGIRGHDTPCIGACRCILGGCVDRCRDGHVPRDNRGKSVAHRLGGCPRVLVERYGGIWKSHNTYSDRAGRDQCCCNVTISGARALGWFNSLDSYNRALYVIECHPAVAGAEHFLAVGAVVSGHPSGATADDIERFQKNKVLAYRMMTDVDSSADAKAKLLSSFLEAAYPGECNRESDVPRRPPKGGFPFTYTFGMMLRAWTHCGPALELLHNRSPESDESEICATTMSCLCMPIMVLREICGAGWFDVPLAAWYKDLKAPLVHIRRTLLFGELRGEKLLVLRKLANVTIRASGDSDFELENFHRAALVTRKHWYSHWAPDHDGLSAFAEYERRYLVEAQDVVRKCVGHLPPDVRAKTIEQFWSERALRGASGASKAIKTIDIQVAELAGGDRPGKKMLVEYLDEEALERALSSRPTNRAYYFVKPEPGLKLRSLYASYDEEAFISAYANQAVENHMKTEKGIMVRQTPADVIEWMAVSAGGLAGPEGQDAYWLSTDYSDYNSEHTQWEMAALDIMCAKVFESGEGGTINHEKACAHFWIGAGRIASTVIYGKAEKYRGKTGMLEDATAGFYTPIINGLYSGARTTARDNTWIHAIDLRLGRQLGDAMFGHCGATWWALCGDDEDVAFRSELHAGAYYATLGAMGHNLNPVKQLAGRDNHEFLQMTAARHERIEKPLNSLLATLATGNWYVQSGLWLQTVVNGVVSNYWECFCRGMPLQVARRMAAATLDLAMVARGSTDAHLEGVAPVAIERKLEWWKYRHGPGLPPLFRWHTDDEMLAMPRYEAVAEPSAGWPSNASTAYAARHSSMLSHLPPRIKKEFILHMQQQTIGSVLKVWQQKQARRWCLSHWPSRSADSEAILACPEQEDWEMSARDNVRLEEFRWGMPQKATMLTEEGVCGRMGVPFFLARKLGGAAKLAGKVTLEQWSNYQDTTTTFYPLSGEGHRLQMNLRACATWATAPIPKIHGDKTRCSWRAMTYAFMGNGAGKSHFCRVHRAAQDIDTVWMDAFGTMRERYSSAALNSYFSTTPQTIQEILSIASKRGPVLLGHVAPKTVVAVAQKLGLDMRVVSYDPGVDTRRSRLSNRDWDDKKVNSRLERSQVGYDEARSMGVEQLGNYDALVHEYVGALCKRATDDNGITTQKKQPAKFVFDRTEAVTRKLEIQQLVLGQC